MAVLFQRRLVDGDALGDGLERGELVEQEIIAAGGDPADRIRAAGAHPHRRMRFLRGRRLDDDVLELPVFALMREALLRRPGFDDDIERLVEARVGFRDRHAESGEFVVAVTLAGAEIEPAAGEQIDGGGLLGEQYRIVPGQHQHRGAESQGLGLCRHPGEQRQAGGNLAEAGEMMFDQEGRVIAERLGLDVIVDELLVALPGIDIRPAMAGRRAAEKSKPHRDVLCCVAV